MAFNRIRILNTLNTSIYSVYYQIASNRQLLDSGCKASVKLVHYLYEPKGHSIRDQLRIRLTPYIYKQIGHARSSQLYSCYTGQVVDQQYQRYINEMLFSYQNIFCTAYLENILIYSQSPEEDQNYVKPVLQRNLDTGLEADIRECTFHVTRTKFPRLIVSTEGIEVDPEKIEAVKDWEISGNTTDIGEE